MLSFANFLEESSLQYHATLNPKLYNLKTNRLQPEVREALLRFAFAWAAYANIPESEIQDVYFTGGNANFNYTSQSDLDCHVVLDKRALGIPDEICDDYLSDKKALWQTKHHASVRGYSLEPYAQDSSERFPDGQGVYSLLRDAWVVEPKHGNFDFEHDPVLERKVDALKAEISKLVNHNGTLEAVKALKDKLNAMRSAGLEKSGEFSLENLVFKELRNDGYIDMLRNYEVDAVDRGLSLD